MRPYIVFCLCLATVGFFVIPLSRVAADEKPDDKAALEKRQAERAHAEWKKGFLPGRSQMAKRKNGVLLQATAKIVAGKEGDEIRLDWTLDYNGPRQPLTILIPTLFDTFGQTTVVFYAEDKDETSLYEYARPSDSWPVPWAPFVQNKELFIKVEKGKKGTGTIVVPVSKVASYYKEGWGQQFKDPPKELYVQLVHAPFDRGEGFGGLDAWTGEVYSPLLKLSLEKLKKW
jgi:hypothetical protein